MKSILPSGFYNLMPIEAKKEQAIIRRYLDILDSSGFLLVRPTPVDFGSFRDGDDRFALVDTITQQLVFFRSDITSQIDRLSSTALAETARPLKLCYCGEVFRQKPSKLDGERQFTQLGAEIIGDEDDNTKLLISLIHKMLGSSNVLIDFFVEAFPQSENFDRKDIASANGDELILRAFRGDKTLANPKFQEIIKDAEKLGLKTSITYFDTNLSAKYNGFAFTIFVDGQEVGRGGTYITEGKENAQGFSLNVNQLR
jgi:Histidyl-tRNA synthetase